MLAGTQPGPLHETQKQGKVGRLERQDEAGTECDSPARSPGPVERPTNGSRQIARADRAAGLHLAGMVGETPGRVCDSSDQSYSLTRQSFIIAGIGWRDRIVGVGSEVWRVEEAKMGSCVASDDVSGIPRRIQNGDRQGLLAI